MNTHADKKSENKSQAVANVLQKQQNDGSSTFQFEDNRPEAIAQRKLQEAINNSPSVQQLKAYQEMADNRSSLQSNPNQNNNTGLPDSLKSGIENLSGYSMDDVKVHYNSDKPDQLYAHAYTQGTDIHIASGQEKHLPHEARHVVQQKQGRVKPTVQMKAEVSINDDAGLEKEADIMGAKLAYSSKQAEPGQAATLNHTAKTSQVIQGVFVQDNQTLLWTDTVTGKVYQQTSTMTGNRIALTAQDGESFIIGRGVDGTWNRVDQQGQVTLTPKRDRGYRVHAEFKGFNTVDTLRNQGRLPKDDLPYSAHGNIRDQEFRDFFSDIPSLPQDQQPSQEYLKLLKERTRAYGTLAQPKPPEKDLHKRPWEQDEDYGFSFDTSSGLPFHQADDLIKSSYQRKDKLEKNLSVQDLYEAQYLSNFNRIVPESALYAPFTQTQQTDHWLTTLGPTLDVNFPPTITDSSAGTDYKGVHTVFKNFLDKLSQNPEFIEKTAEDTQLFLDECLKNVAIEAHQEAYLGSSNKKKSKSAKEEGNKAKKRKTLSRAEQEKIAQAHTDIPSFLSGEDPQFSTTPMAKNVQKIAYLFYIKLIKRAITNVIMLMHSNVQIFATEENRASDQDIRQDLEQIMNTLLSRFSRLSELQSILYTGSNDQTSDSDDDDVYQPYIPQEVQLLAQQNGVQAQYGGSHGNNCLIYAIAGALGVHLSDQAAANIRNWLNNNSAQSGHFSPHGQLPMLPGLIQEITNRLIQQGLQINGNVTVVTTDGNFNAQGGVANNANDGNVLVILHGGHYYFTQQQKIKHNTKNQ